MNILAIWGGASILFIVLTSIIAAVVNAQRYKNWLDNSYNAQSPTDKAFNATLEWLAFTIILSVAVGLLVFGLWLLQTGFAAPR